MQTYIEHRACDNCKKEDKTISPMRDVIFKEWVTVNVPHKCARMVVGHKDYHFCCLDCAIQFLPKLKEESK